MMKKLLLTLLFGILGVGVYGQTIKSLGYNTTNGQVVYSGTNTLTFLKNIQIKGSDTTNIPTLFWQTSDGVGDGSMLAFSRRHATNLWFGINQTNWSQGAWGQNIQPTADGNDFTRKNTNFGSVALVLENEYNSEQNTNNPARTVAEMYFDVTDISGQRTRPLMFVGSQTNSALGWGYSVYPLTIGVTNLGWNAASALKVEFNNAGAGGTAVIANMATNGGSYAELQFVNSANSTIFYAKQNKFEIYGNHSPSYHILQAVTNGVIIGGAFSSSAAQRVQLGGNTRIDGAISFNATTNADITRTNLGLGWSALTNTNASNFRNAIDLGTNDSPRFGAVNVIDTIFSFGQTLISGGSISVNNSNSQGVSMNPAGYTAGSINIVSGVGGNTNAITFSAAAAAATRTNLGLGLSVLTNTNNANFLSDLGIGTNSSPSFSNVSVSNLLVTGNFTNLGTIYGFKTNVGPFEGIGNFFASNNTTVSNETLFRVGLAEQNDKSAQFGFRVARTNNGGEGFAVFSVFGYNALMMIGPSDRSRSNSITNTNAGIEADIWSISPTNKVMTLITTNTGAMQMHRPIGFNTNASAPANTTNVVGWIEMYVGTNSVRVPYYQ